MSNIRPYDPYSSNLYPIDQDYGNITLNPNRCHYREQPLPKMFIISVRHDAWNFNTFTTMYDVCCPLRSCSWNELKGKRILILVGGYTSTEVQILDAVARTASKTRTLYDAVIGFVYPSGSLPSRYYIQARDVADCAAVLFRNILNNLSKDTTIDIAAHSMGVHLTLTALNADITPDIWNLFLMGGAEKQESLNECIGNQCTTFPQTLRKVAQIFTIASCNDDTLPWHTFVLGEETMGRPTEWHQPLLSSKVTVIDATDIVDGHGGFLTSEAIFNAINYFSPGICRPYKAYVLQRNGDPIPGNKAMTCKQTYRQIVAPLTSLVLHPMAKTFSREYR